MMRLLADGAEDVFGPFCGWTFLLRFGEYTLMMAPGLLTGVLAAGLLRTRAGRGWLLACLDGSPARSFTHAAILGLVAPVGALGALPIASEMLRARVRPGVALCFLITAPLFMPWSFGHAVDRLGLLSTVLVVLGGVCLALIIGVCMSWLRRAPGDARLPESHETGSQVLTALRAASRHCVGWLPLYVFIASGASATLAAVLQPGAIEGHLGESSTRTLLQLTVPLALATLDSDLAIALAGEFWRIGLLTGGVFAAFYLGSAWSLGTLAWCLRHLGRAGAIASILWLAVAIALAALGNRAIAPPRPDEADSHAFDLMTKPYNFGGSSPALGVAAQLRGTAQGSKVALGALLILTVAGLLDRTLQGRLASAWRDNPRPPVDEPCASPLTVRTTLAGASTICLVASMYTYFAPLEELRDRLRLHGGNLAEAAATLTSPHRTPEERSSARTRALNALDGIDDTLLRIPVSRALHFGVSSPALLDTAPLRTAVRHLEQLILAGSAAEITPATRELVRQLMRAR